MHPSRPFFLLVLVHSYLDQFDPNLHPVSSVFHLFVRSQADQFSYTYTKPIFLLFIMCHLHCSSLRASAPMSTVPSGKKCIFQISLWPIYFLVLVHSYRDLLDFNCTCFWGPQLFQISSLVGVVNCLLQDIGLGLSLCPPEYVAASDQLSFFSGCVIHTAVASMPMHLCLWS